MKNINIKNNTSTPVKNANTPEHKKISKRYWYQYPVKLTQLCHRAQQIPAAFFSRHFSVIDRFFYEMTKKLYVISDKSFEKYLAALSRVYSLKKTFRKKRFEKLGESCRENFQ